MGFNDINLQVSGPQQPASIYKTKVLKGQVPFATQVTEPNTKYVIKHNFELDDDVTIPANCIIEFDGGSISGEYTLTGNNTGIEAGLVKIFSTDVTLGGTWNVVEAYPEWFGAVGNGIADDIDAFESILTKTPFNLQMPKNKTYAVSKSIIVDVQNHSILGTDGTSKIKALNELSDALVILKGYGENNWADRQNRVRKHGNFTLICGDLNNNYCDGLRIGGKYGTDFESHVDEQYVENVFIDYPQKAMVIGSHVYKIKLFNIVQRGASVSPLFYDTNSTDDGECTEFEQCSFWDSGKTVELRHQTNFFNCTFHCNIIAIGIEQVFCFEQCHFELLNGERINGDYFLYSDGVFMYLHNCDATIGGNNNVEMKYFAKAVNSGSIIIDGGVWKFFLTRLNITEDTVTFGNVKLMNLVLPFNWYSYGALSSKPIYSSTITNFAKSLYAKIANISEDRRYGYPLECVKNANIDCNYDFSLPDENGKITLTINNFYGNIQFYKLIKPISKGSIRLFWDFTIGDGAALSLPDGAVMFFDAQKNLLPYKEYNNNNDILLSKTSTDEDNDFTGSRIVAIPPGTEEIGLAFTISKNASSTSISINKFYCEFL